MLKQTEKSMVAHLNQVVFLVCVARAQKVYIIINLFLGLRKVYFFGNREKTWICWDKIQFSFITKWHSWACSSFLESSKLGSNNIRVSKSSTRKKLLLLMQKLEEVAQWTRNGNILQHNCDNKVALLYLDTMPKC